MGELQPRSRLRESTGAEAQTRLGLHFVLFPGPSSSGDDITSPVPATQFSGCTTGTHSQADVDCPESQEVLVSKEGFLQFGR